MTAVYSRSCSVSYIMVHPRAYSIETPNLFVPRGSPEIKFIEKNGILFVRSR